VRGIVDERSRWCSKTRRIDVASCSISFSRANLWKGRQTLLTGGCNDKCLNVHQFASIAAAEITIEA
jgi:hypothetical protein